MFVFLLSLWKCSHTVCYFKCMNRKCKAEHVFQPAGKLNGDKSARKSKYKKENLFTYSGNLFILAED